MKINSFILLLLAASFSCYAMEPLDSYVAKAIAQSKQSSFAGNYQSITYVAARDVKPEILIDQIFKVTSFDVGRIREVNHFSIAQVKSYKIKDHVFTSALCLTDLGPMIVSYDCNDIESSNDVSWNIRSPEMMR